MYCEGLSCIVPPQVQDVPSVPVKETDWTVKKVPEVEAVLARHLGRPEPPRMVYCPKHPVFDFIPARIRRIVNPKASLLSCSASLQVSKDVSKPGDILYSEKLHRF